MDWTADAQLLEVEGYGRLGTLRGVRQATGGRVGFLGRAFISSFLHKFSAVVMCGV